MFMTIQTNEGATAIINPAHITHVTPADTAYEAEGSVIHFTSDRVIQVKEDIEAVVRMLASAGNGQPAGPGGRPFLVSS